MQEERVESGGKFGAGPSVYIAENPSIIGFNNALISEKDFIPWTTPSARFENIVPA